MSIFSDLFGGEERAIAYRFTPEGAVGLLFEGALQVKVFRVVCGLCARVADITLCVQTLCYLHSVLGTHS